MTSLTANAAQPSTSSSSSSSSLSTTVQALPRLLRSLPFAIGLVVPVVGLALVLSPSGPILYALPAIIFGVIPLLDAVLGYQQQMVEPESAATSGRDWRYDLWLWLWVPLQVIAVVVGIVTIGGGLGGAHPLTGWEFVLATVSVGLFTGVGINVAHELMHRRGKVERALAEVLMTTTTYTHFCVEHVLGHHKHVSTPVDPASSHLGDTLYGYLPRTLLGGLRSAWRIEDKRRRQAGLPWWSWKNRQFRYGLTLALVYVVIAATVGVMGVVFFAGQSLVAMCLLETINYIEHYGLARREIRPGVYERTMPWHSWNASQRLTNWFLFHLQRHADHHHIASRPFYALRHIDDSPQLPAGYATMVLLATVPPLWRLVMDHRVIAWTERQRVLEGVAD
jgi:alkane 1-monooxygenase